MAGTPTPWAGLPLPAEGDLPDVPTDVKALGTAIDSLLKLLCTTGPSSSTPVPTTGQNLLNVGPSITTLQSTQSTQAGQISTVQTNVAALQTLTSILNNAPSGFVEVNNTPPRIASGSAATTVVTHTIPTAGYKRLLLCSMSCSYYWENLSNIPLQFWGYITVGSTTSQALTYYGSGNANAPAQNFNGTFLTTIPASATATVYTQVGAFLPSGSSHAAFGFPVPTIWGALLPWSNGPDIAMPY